MQGPLNDTIIDYLVRQGVQSHLGPVAGSQHSELSQYKSLSGRSLSSSMKKDTNVMNGTF